jgi:membrane protein DedA with SNARE-associated domain
VVDGAKEAESLRSVAVDFLMRLVAENGVVVVFLVVLVEQLGVPLPAYPILLVSRGLAVRGDLAWPQLLTAAVAASVLADNAWYAADTGTVAAFSASCVACR